MGHPPEDPAPPVDNGAGGGPHDVPWFLPSGRAGLAPESVTVDYEPDARDDSAVGRQVAADRQASAGPEVVGAPPWAAESAGQEPAAPPPWESGPWPSHDTRSLDNGMPEAADWPADDSETDHGATAVDDIHDPLRYRPQSSGDLAEPAPANGLATAALVAGIAGIAVVPGVVLGILGLRRARVTGIGVVQSWLGIVLSLAWAIGIIVFFTLPGGGSSADPGCAVYQPAARAAVARATSALAVGAPDSQLRSDLGKAARTVNSAAAKAQDMTVRSALSVMTGDLQAALGEVTADRPVPAVLKTALSRDSAAAAGLCGGPSA
jgi:hypothetical protein